MTVRKTLSDLEAIHIPSERYRLLKLAEESAIQGDTMKASDLIYVARELGTLPQTSNGAFYIKGWPDENEEDSVDDNE